ncbi:methyl-accepting chemotaxis protein [Telmatospirillum sp.]|uniref:methyl-accepting chemotaxis protein n=1 Tax=Telmatospirillum sp. TaxID=2079197 RepID=UPI00283BBCEF|nr:methyl-accepting chemotaxis protein [Telmatospirillum sp.]MDR3439632.1 methyl-accepting chemotaxis protein [Telmatospirillum sp.]
MRIRAFFLSAMATAAAVGLVSASVVVVGAVNDYQNAGLAHRYADAYGAVARVAERIASERGEMNAQLVSDAQADGAAKSRLDYRSSDTREQTRQAVAVLETIDREPGRQVLETARQTAAKMDDLRATVATQAQRAKADRDAALMGSLVSTTSKLIDGLTQTLDVLHRQISEVDGKGSQLLVLARASIDMRVWAGQRGVILSALYAGHKAAPRETQAQLAGLTGRIDENWRQIRFLAEEVGSSDLLATALQKTEADYFRNTASLYGPVMLGVTGDAAYPEDFPAFRKTQLEVLLPATTFPRDAAIAELLKRTDTNQAAAAWRVTWSLGLVLLTIGICAVLSVLFERRVLTPLAILTRVIVRLSSGDRTADVPSQNFSGEMSKLADEIGTLCANARQAAALADENAANQRDRERHTVEIEKVCSSFYGESQELIADMSDSARQAVAQARSTEAMAADVKSRVSAAATSASQASSGVGTVAAAAEEMAASINEITSQVSHVSEVASRAVTEVDDASRRIVGLEEASSRIGDILRLITDIAGQTNLLALNATIEAARAGDAGKGFAVVAGEVKALANQTAKATDEISGQIGSIQKMTGDAVHSIRNVGATIGQIDEFASAVSAAVQQQGQTTKEIAQSVQGAAENTHEVSEAVAHAADVMSRTEQASQDLVAHMDTLGQRAESLTCGLARFLGEVRTV